MLLIAFLFFILGKSWRVREIHCPVGFEKKRKAIHQGLEFKEGRENFIFAHLHGDELMLMPLYAWRNIAVLVSLSRDGSRWSRVLRLFGYRVVRGSSSRGGARGLLELIKLVKKETYHISMAVDGPRGPLGKSKPGVLAIAARLRCPIIPVAATAKKYFLFKKSWNQAFIPLPWTKCVVVYGEPIEVPQKLTKADERDYLVRLDKALFDVKKEAKDLLN